MAALKSRQVYLGQSQLIIGSMTVRTTVGPQLIAHIDVVPSIAIPTSNAAVVVLLLRLMWGQPVKF